MIRDKIVFGVRDERYKERLLREGEVTLQKVLDICRAADSSRQQLDGLKGAKQVYAVDWTYDMPPNQAGSSSMA